MENSTNIEKEPWVEIKSAGKLRPIIIIIVIIIAVVTVIGGVVGRIYSKCKY